MKVPFRDLPANVRERLAQATASPEPPPDHFVIPTESTRWKGVTTVFGALCMLAVLVVGVVEDSRWREEERLAVAGGAVIASLIFTFAFLRRRAMLASPVKPAIVVTPIAIAQTRLAHEPVEMHHLKSLSDTAITHHSTNGVYQHTTFDLKFGDDRMWFMVSPKPRAEALLEFLRAGPDRVRAWIAEGSAQAKIEAFDWPGAIEKAGPAPEHSDVPGAGVLQRSRLARFAASLAIAACLTGVALGAHEVRYEQSMWAYARASDTPSEYRWYLENAPLGWHEAEAEAAIVPAAWRIAQREDRASSYRKFRAEFPQAPQAEDAKKRLHDLYEAAAKRYAAESRGALPQAAAGMEALLARLRENQDPVVWIYFMPAEGLEGGAIERAIAEQTGATRIEPVSPSFTAERNQMREGRIADSMRAAFGRIFSDDLFDLKLARGAEPGSRFLVRYRVVGDEGSFYFQEKEAHLPVSQRRIFVGIALEFDFTLQVTDEDQVAEEDPTKGYRFSTRAVPAPNFTVRHSAAAGMTTGAVYDTMADTAFREFETRLTAAYGIGTGAAVPTSHEEEGE